jgi:hypothetical protein
MKQNQHKRRSDPGPLKPSADGQELNDGRGRRGALPWTRRRRRRPPARRRRRQRRPSPGGEGAADRRRAWAGRPVAAAAALKKRGEIRSGVDMTPVACGCGEIKPKRRGRGGAAGRGAGGWRWPRCLRHKLGIFFFFFFERHELGVEGPDFACFLF